MDLEKFDVPAILDYVTGLDQWELVNQKKVDNSFEWKYKLGDVHEAYVVLDEEKVLSVIVDGDTMYFGELEEDDDLAPFWKQSPENHADDS